MIRFENFSFSYPMSGQKQLKDICLNIHRGECVLLCGESACGKTTLTKCINGLIPHFIEGESSGNVYLGENDIRQIPTYRISQSVGSVFQNPKTQFFNLDSTSELMFGAENIAMDPKTIHQRMDSAVREFGIENLPHRNVFELSAGEKQLLALASVYIVNPDIYVLDEPSANMDRESIEKLTKILLKLKKQGKTVIISEHRLYFLTEIIDRAVYIQNGKITQIFSREEFVSITEQKRKALGLRTFTLREKSEQNPLPIKDACLEVRNLTLCAKGKTLLEDVSFSADRHDVIAVTGENGCGKSLLLRALCGLYREKSGKVSYMGKTLSCKKRMKYCTLTVQDILHQLFSDTVQGEFTLMNRSITQDTIEDILRKVLLYETRTRHPMTLSGGQKQRLILSVAACVKKDIVLLDEPSSGLDYRNLCMVSNIIRALSEKSIVFIATHDRELIELSASKELKIKDGHAVLYRYTKEYPENGQSE